MRMTMEYAILGLAIELAIQECRLPGDHQQARETTNCLKLCRSWWDINKHKIYKASLYSVRWESSVIYLFRILCCLKLVTRRYGSDSTTVKSITSGDGSTRVQLITRQWTYAMLLYFRVMWGFDTAHERNVISPKSDLDVPSLIYRWRLIFDSNMIVEPQKDGVKLLTGTRNPLK